MELNNKQIELLEKIGASPNDDEDIIEEKVGDYLQIYGFDEDYNITEEGKICEEILDSIS